MGKKRARESDGLSVIDDHMADAEEEEDFDMVDVELEWFNFDASIDFHGTKTLLRQLLDVDAPHVDTSALSDLVLRQNTIGSTVKVDGKTSDAYALLTALSLREQRAEPPMAGLTAYLAARAATSSDLAPLVPLLAQQAEPPVDGAPGAPGTPGAPHVGLILTERLINMPAEVAPPLYAMLLDELEAAVEDGEPYAFTHFLVLSKAYEEVASALKEGDDDTAKQSKKKKARTIPGGPPPLCYFHVEDEVLRKYALASGTFTYTNDDAAVADSKRAFHETGVQPQGLLLLIEASRMPDAIKAMEKFVKS